MSESLPLPNDPASRTPDGTIVDTRDLTPTPNPNPSTPTDPKPNESPRDPASPAPTKPDAPVVPDTYVFKTSEGTAADPKLVEAATPIFRELGLTQPQADKLIELWNSQAKAQNDSVNNAVVEMAKRWEAETLADPELGPNIDKIKADVGRAYDLMDSKAVAAFKTAMNDTAIGFNPAFVRVFWEMAKRMGPGSHVPGGAPSPHGQSPSGQTSRPSVAASMWPGLKAS